MRTNNNDWDRLLKREMTILRMMIVWEILIVVFIIIGAICTGCSVYLGKGCTLETRVVNNDKIQSCIECDSTSYYFRQQKSKQGSLP